MRKEKSAGAVIFRKEGKDFSCLLLQYEAGHWDFPRGLVEEKENLLEAARREIKEETGVDDIEFIPGFEGEMNYFYKFKGETVFKTVIYFLAETKTKKVNTSGEHQGFEWLTYDDALERITFDNSKNILKKAWLFLSEKEKA